MLEACLDQALCGYTRHFILVENCWELLMNRACKTSSCYSVCKERGFLLTEYLYQNVFLQLDCERNNVKSGLFINQNKTKSIYRKSSVSVSHSANQ